MALGKPFVGICLTDAHAKGVRTQVANKVFIGFWTEGSPFYDARIAKDLQDAGLGKAANSGSVSIDPVKPTAKAKAPQPKPKPKASGGETPATPKASGTPPNAPSGVQPPPLKRPRLPSVAEKMKAALAALGGGRGGGDGEEGEAVCDGDGEEVECDALIDCE